MVLDDATSEIYYAQLVEAESTAAVMTAIRQVIEAKGIFCSLYSDRASHFWTTPKAGEAVDRQSLTSSGGVEGVGDKDDTRLLATGQRALFPYLAGTPSRRNLG